MQQRCETRAKSAATEVTAVTRITDRRCVGSSNRSKVVSILSDNEKKEGVENSDRRCTGSINRSKVVSTLPDNEGVEYSALAEDINQTIDEVVPKKKNMFKNGRSISEETRKLYEQRRKEFSKDNQDEETETRKKWNKRIKNAVHNDYRR